MSKIETEIWRFLQAFGNQVYEQVNGTQFAKYVSGLVSQTDMDEIVSRWNAIQWSRTTLDRLLQMPQVAQRSPEWHALRRNRLTASDTAQALGKGKFGTIKDLLYKKAFPDHQPPFSLNVPPLHWGVMFEPMAARCYCQRHLDIRVHEFGLIPHATIDCYGASPDGISELGIMIEYKCPYKRKIDGHIPEQYELQMQGQMAVCGLTECDYVECDMQRLFTAEEYVASVAPTMRVDHGIIVERPEEDTRFVYSPEYSTTHEALSWMQTEKGSFRVWYWKLRKINICRVQFDETRWKSIVPDLQAFWNRVLEARKQPPPAGKTLDLELPIKRKKVDLDFIQDEDDVAT